SLLPTAGDAEAVAGGRLAVAPAELLGRRLQHGPHSRVGQVLEAELQRVHPDGVSQVIEVALPGEMIGRRREGAVRALPQRGARRMELAPLVRNLVGWTRTDGGAAGIVIVELPGRDRPVLPHAAGDLNDPGRAEVGPREFLLPRPDQFDRLA